MPDLSFLTSESFGVSEYISSSDKMDNLCSGKRHERRRMYQMIT